MRDSMREKEACGERGEGDACVHEIGVQAYVCDRDSKAEDEATFDTRQRSMGEGERRGRSVLITSACLVLANSFSLCCCFGTWPRVFCFH